MTVEVNCKQQIPLDAEISEKLPTPIYLIILQKEIGHLTSAKDIFNSYCTTRLTCKYLYQYATNEKPDDLRKYLKINEVKTNVFVNIFNELVNRSWNNQYKVSNAIIFISKDLSLKMKQLLIENKVKDLLLLTDKMLPQNKGVERHALEKVIADVIDEPYNPYFAWDHMLTNLSLICAKKDACATAQVFNRIPIHFLKNGEEVGKECARNDPEATLKYIDNFKKVMHVESWGRILTSHVDNIIAEANANLSSGAL